MLVSHVLLTDVPHPLLRLSRGERQPIRHVRAVPIWARWSDPD